MQIVALQRCPKDERRQINDLKVLKISQLIDEHIPSLTQEQDFEIGQNINN